MAVAIHKYISLRTPKEQIELDISSFADGTKRVIIPDIDQFDMQKEFRIDVYHRSMDDIMAVAQIVDIIRRNTRVIPDITLTLNSPAYMRYDRVMLKTRRDAFALNQFADMLKCTGVNKVLVLDPHSEVFRELMNLKGVMTIELRQSGCLDDVVREYMDLGMYPITSAMQTKYDILVPDAGAAKKWSASRGRKIYNSTKSRNPKTGHLSDFAIDDKDFEKLMESKQERLLIVDDICENGGTFIGCVEMLRKRGFTKPVDLYVTHGIFPKHEPMLLMGETFENIFIHSCKLDTYNALNTFCNSKIFALNTYTGY